MSDSWKKESKIPPVVGILSYLSLIPLILFSVMDLFEVAIFGALALAIIASLVAKRFKALKLIDIIFASFFAICAIAIMLYPPSISIVEQYYTAMLWFVLALMAGISLIQRNPFTLQHAKQISSEAVWNTPFFYDVNKLLTVIFLLVFSVNTGVSIILFDNILRLPISFGLLGLALLLSKILPSYYLDYITKKAPASDVDFSDLSVDELFDGMVSNFDSEEAKNWSTVIQYNIEGEQGGRFFIEVRDGSCSLSKEHTEQPKLVLTVDFEDWRAISQGALAGMRAYLDGKLIVEGDMNDLLKMEVVFPSGH